MIDYARANGQPTSLPRGSSLARKNARVTDETASTSSRYGFHEGDVP
jgi:hypothetical protein